jgi:ribosomal protein S18 acetylase RimI-like enzyme
VIRAWSVDPATVQAASASQLAQFNEQIEGFRGLVTPEVTLFATSQPVAWVNAASSARFSARNADERIDDVIEWFGALGLPFSWSVGPNDRPRDLAKRLVARGFIAEPDATPGMAADVRRTLPKETLPLGGSMELVRDAAGFEEWLDVVVEGFGMPPELRVEFHRYGSLGFEDDVPLRYVLARQDGRPVATALGVLAGGGVTIINVTTLEADRGRGFGRAVTIAAMESGRAAGATIAVLQSTDMGYGLYRSLGFEDFGRYRSFAWMGTGP